MAEKTSSVKEFAVLFEKLTESEKKTIIGLIESLLSKK